MPCAGEIMQVASATASRSFSRGFKWSFFSLTAKLEASIAATQAVDRDVVRKEAFACRLCKRNNPPERCECGLAEEEFLPAIEVYAPATTWFGLGWGGTWTITYSVKIKLPCTEANELGGADIAPITGSTVTGQ
jgi:hypothetical protein